MSVIKGGVRYISWAHELHLSWDLGKLHQGEALRLTSQSLQCKLAVQFLFHFSLYFEACTLYVKEEKFLLGKRDVK